MPLSSRVHIRNQFGLEIGDLVFQFEFALLQSRELQLVDARVYCQALDGEVEVAMLFAQLGQLGDDFAGIVGIGIHILKDSTDLAQRIIIPESPLGDTPWLDL